MKVLVTGGCGFLGSNIAASYLDQKADVFVIDALFRKGSSSNLEWLKGHENATNFYFEQFDLAEQPKVASFFETHGPFDYICHLGGQVAMTTSLTDPSRDFQTNALGTFNVLEAMRKYSADALLAYSSTNKVYGDMENLNCEEKESRYSLVDYPQGLNEAMPLDFASPYGCSKGAADQYVHDWYRNYGLKTVVFRHSSIYGGRQFATADQGWIGWFCQQAIDQKNAYLEGAAPVPFTISGTGKQVRDVLHAEDLIRLYQAAFNNKEQVAGEVFNIGGGLSNSLSLLELFALLKRLLSFQNGEEILFERIERRQSDQDVFVADIEKASRVMGWSPSVSAEEGIKKMISWVKSNDI